MKWRGVSIWVLGSALVGCGDTSTIRLSYQSSPTDPDLVVIVSANTAAAALGDFKQNVQSVDGSTFYDSIDAIKGCALSGKNLVSGNLTSFGSTSSGADSFCTTTLSRHLKCNIFKFNEPTYSGTYTGADLKLKDKSNGYIVAFFLFNQSNLSATYRCFQVYAAEVQNGKIVDRSGGTPTLKSSVTVPLVPESDGTKCISYKLINFNAECT